MKKLCLIIFLLFSCIILVEAQQKTISLNAFIDKTELPLNQMLTFTVKISWEGEEEEYEVESIQSPMCKNLKIMGYSSANKVEARQNQLISIKEYKFTLQPQELGMGYIEPVIIYYKKKNSNQQYSIKTTRIGVEILPPVTSKEGKGKYKVIGIILIIILIGIIGLIIYLLKKKGSQVEEVVEEVKTKEEEALEKLKTIAVSRKDFVDYYSKISLILREYLQAKFDIKTLEVPTKEILDSLKQLDLEESLITQAEEILSACDMVKFAKHEPQPPELDHIYGKVEKFLEGNRTS
ncbi:MAG: hypothetical protein AB1567_06125 [bacterium]